MEGSSSKSSMDFDEMSLKILTICRHQKDHKPYNACVKTSSKLSPTSSSCSSDVSGDYIGTESCFDVLSDDKDYVVSAEPREDRLTTTRVSRPRGRRESKAVAAAAAREFPPPIPLLARTENLSSHMPWVLKRVYTSDGRLILREEKVRHHEYFRAHRSNGRLTLQLVPLDDDVFHPSLGEPYHRHHDHDIVPHHDHDNDHHGDVSEDADNKVSFARDVDNRDDDDGGDGSFIHHDTFHGDDEGDRDDDDGREYDEGEGDDHEEEGSGKVDVGERGGIDGGDDRRRIIKVSTKADQTVVESGMVSSGSPVGKCFQSCFLGMQVPEIRPVLS